MSLAAYQLQAGGGGMRFGDAWLNLDGSNMQRGLQNKFVFGASKANYAIVLDLLMLHVLCKERMYVPHYIRSYVCCIQYVPHTYMLRMYGGHTG